MKNIFLIFSLLGLNPLYAQLKIVETGILYDNHSFVPTNSNFFPHVGDQCDVNFTISNSAQFVPIGGVELVISFPNNYYFDYTATLEEPIGWILMSSSVGANGLEIIYTNSAVLPSGYVDNVKLRAVAIQESWEDFNATAGYFTANKVALRYSGSSTSAWSISPESLTGYTHSALIGSSAPLTAQYLNLLAYPADNKIQLEWQLSHVDPLKEPITHFDILRSSDARSWTTIASVPFTEGQVFYNYTDSLFKTEDNWYRIEAYNFDKIYTISDVRHIYMKSQWNVKPQIYPNPATDILNIDFSNNNKPLQVNIIDVSGKVLKTFIIDQNQNTIDISSLTAGQYFLMIMTDDETFYHKLLVIK